MEKQQNRNSRNPWPYIRDFFVYVRDTGPDGVLFQCQMCLPLKKSYCASRKSMYNLKKHVSLKHNHAKVAFDVCIRAGVSKTRKKPANTPATTGRTINASIAES